MGGGASRQDVGDGVSYLGPYMFRESRNCINHRHFSCKFVSYKQEKCKQRDQKGQLLRHDGFSEPNSWNANENSESARRGNKQKTNKIRIFRSSMVF